MQNIPLSQIRPSRWQYRQRFDEDALLELARSIEAHGLINPPLAFRDEDGDFELIAGERRVRATVALALARESGWWIAEHGDDLATAVAHIAEHGWVQLAPDFQRDLGEATIRCEVRPGQADDFREIVILENLQRQDPSPVEEARAFQVLLEEAGYSQSKLAARLGKSQGYISQRIGLLGLAPAVQEVAASGAVPFASMRAIATLPVDAQVAVTEYVQAAPPAEMTSRKIQNLARLGRRFLDPATWEPPADRPLEPCVYNRLRLIRHLVGELPPARAGAAIVELKTDGLLGKKPLSIADKQFRAHQVIRILADRWRNYADNYRYDPPWREIAPAQGWDCEHCQMQSARVPAMHGQDPICERWASPAAVENSLSTCWNFVGADDPVVLPLSGYGRDLDLALAAGHGEDLEQYGSMRYATDMETFILIQEDIGLGLADAQAARERDRSEGHLVTLRAYWRSQGGDAETPSCWGVGLFNDSAHRCPLCAHYREDLQAQGLPPCRFAVEPLIKHGKVTAPGMGVLVRMSGMMVPRCDRFHFREMPEMLVLGNWRFAGRARVLRWLEHIIRDAGSFSHENTLNPPLAWLPYERGDARYDTPMLFTYLTRHWDDMGDAGLAALLDIAVSEAAARSLHGNPFELQAWGGHDSWAAIGWAEVVEGRKPWHGWPVDWPMPWLKPAWRERFTRVIEVEVDDGE